MFWETIREVITSGNSSASQDILLKDKGVKMDKSDMADYINDYFINVGNVVRQIEPSDPSPPEEERNMVELTDSDQPSDPELCHDDKHSLVCSNKLNPTILRETEVC